MFLTNITSVAAIVMIQVIKCNPFISLSYLIKYSGCCLQKPEYKIKAYIKGFQRSHRAMKKGCTRLTFTSLQFLYEFEIIIHFRFWRWNLGDSLVHRRLRVNVTFSFVHLPSVTALTWPGGSGAFFRSTGKEYTLDQTVIIGVTYNIHI